MRKLWNRSVLVLAAIVMVPWHLVVNLFVALPRDVALGVTADWEEIKNLWNEQ